MTDVRRYLRESDGHPATKNATVVAIKSLHRYGVLEGLWEANGLLELHGPKQVRNAREALTTDEARSLLDICSRPNETRLCYLGLLGGLRVTEITGITDAQWLPDRLRFVGKGRRVREVPVHPELAERKDLILSSRPTRDSLKMTCRSLSFYTGFRFATHTLRRTFAVTLVDLGFAREVGALLGHALGVTELYAPVTWQERLQAIAKLAY